MKEEINLKLKKDVEEPGKITEVDSDEKYNPKPEREKEEEDEAITKEINKSTELIERKIKEEIHDEPDEPGGPRNVN